MQEITPAIHFVGFRTKEEIRVATVIWGPPDFVHKTHDQRMYGYVADNDTVILGSKGAAEPDPKYNWQDHEDPEYMELFK